MIIGQFCDVYPPHLDGVGTVVKNYAIELTSAGDECYYIAPNAENDEGPTAFKTLLYKSVKLAGEAYHIGLPFTDISFQKVLLGINFDILHAHSPFGAGHQALWLSQIKHVPIVATFHSKYYDDFYKKTKSKRVARLMVKSIVDFYNKCTEVWTVNTATADVLSSYGYKKEIYIMPNGTNPWNPKKDISREIRNEYGASEMPLFLFVGQMNWKKNIRCTLDALKLYSMEHDFKMLLIGSGPDFDEIVGYVQQLGLQDKFIFPGHISDRERLMSVYASCDLFLFPSIYDNAPMVMREAAAAGTPSILVKGSCASEGIMDSYNGFLCDDSPESLCNAIIHALPKAKDVGAAAKETIPVKWDVIIKSARERYVTLIESSGK
ncbi:MAG: glycosyltransferase [Oscillospiraceae bacterium]|nr:glycosyltransferase [Oscillospiraceae bacterium]